LRRTSTVKIDDDEYTVKELTVREIVTLFSNQQFNNGGSPDDQQNKPILSPELFGIGPFLDHLLELAIAEKPKKEDLQKYAPSELKILYDAFKDVNSHFFEVAQKMKLGQLLDQIMTEVSKSFTDSAVALSKVGMSTLST